MVKNGYITDVQSRIKEIPSEVAIVFDKIIEKVEKNIMLLYEIRKIKNRL